MTAERKNAAAPLADLVPEIVRLVPQLTDEEWAARDAEVQRARDAAAVDPNDRLCRLEALGFPRRAIKAIRLGITPPESFTRLRDACGDDVGIVVLSGPKGTGKTVAATWWAAQRRDRVRFVRASELLASSRYDREARAELLAHPLVLDDLGAEYADPKGSFVADLDELVDVFYGNMRPLIITTNIVKVERTPDGTVRHPFVERYGERIADRLRECGRWITMTGESMRRRP